MEKLLRYYETSIKQKKSNLLIKGVDYKEIDHLVWMCQEARTMEDYEKANRWIGFIQGVLFCWGVYSIDNLRDQTRQMMLGERMGV